MGEGNHLPTTGKAAATNRLWMAVGGTGAVLLAGLIVMQTMRAQPGQAAAERAPAAAKVNAGKRPDVLAMVGSEAVAYDLVADECVKRYGKDILEEIINRMIIDQACRQRGISVTEEEVTAEVNRIAKRFQLDPNSWYQMLQAERNISPDHYRKNVIWPMLALKKLAGEQVDISEDEMNQAFVRNYGPRVKARLIMLDKISRANECWEKCKQNPDDFEKYAQEYSIEPNSRSLGGTIPPIPRYSGNETLEKAAFKLQAGEISGLIELQQGRYAILKCEGRTESGITSIDQVRDQLYEELLESKTQESVATIFKTLKENTQVDNYLAQTHTGPNRPLSTPAPGAVQPAGAARAGTATTRQSAGNAPGTATLRRNP